ncbi:MAG: 50S ribosomal protein L29 [Lentisphaeria bacterium]|jgi:large subunit ribosomal protein L29
MKAKQIREMTDAELGKQLGDLKKEGFNLKLQQVTGQLTNTARVREVRKDAARILTEQTARARKAAAAATTDGK